VTKKRMSEARHARAASTQRISRCTAAALARTWLALLMLVLPLRTAHAQPAEADAASTQASPAMAASGSAVLPAVATGRDTPKPVELAPGVYAMLGNGDAVAPRNHGIVANNGFLVGPSGVVVIDTGSSYRYGRAMIEAIHRVTPLPIDLVILTHQAPEFVFGAAAFRDAGVPILAHRRTAELIAARCAICLKNLRRTLGEDEMAGSRVTVPDRTVDDSTRLQVGGRELELLYFGTAATPGDLAVRDVQTGVLFAGALVNIGRIPELRNESIPGWLAALKRIDNTPGVAKVVPAFGPVVAPARIGEAGEYLRALDAAVRHAYASGDGLVSAKERTQTPRFRTWKLYSVAHPQNVQRVYLELEQR
jgi:glyoxylase-like metal-dependent hydrolase (beta-lactamase superfamily II)